MKCVDCTLTIAFSSDSTQVGSELCVLEAGSGDATEKGPALIAVAERSSRRTAARSDFATLITRPSRSISFNHFPPATLIAAAEICGFQHAAAAQIESRSLPAAAQEQQKDSDRSRSGFNNRARRRWRRPKNCSTQHSHWSSAAAAAGCAADSQRAPKLAAAGNPTHRPRGEQTQHLCAYVPYYASYDIRKASSAKQATCFSRAHAFRSRVFTSVTWCFGRKIC